MEYRKALASFGFNINLDSKNSVDIDNSTDVDNFWNSLVSCTTNTYGDNAQVDSTNNTITVSLSDFQKFVFSKEDNGVFASLAMPFYVGIDDTQYLTGRQERVVFPLVNVQSASIKGIKSKPTLFNLYPITYYFSVYVYFIIAYSILLEQLGTDYILLNGNFNKEWTNLDYSMTRDDIISLAKEVASAYTDSQTVEDIGSYLEEWLSDQIGVLNVKSLKVSFQLSGLESLVAKTSINGSLHFYDSGFVSELTYSTVIPTVNIKPSSLLHIELVADLYDTNNNAVYTDRTISLDYKGYGVVILQKSSFKKGVFTFGRLSRESSYDYGVLKSKVLDTNPVYSVDNVIDNLSVGDYVVVFSENGYAYRTVVAIDSQNLTVELDSDIPETPAYYSKEPPNCLAMNVPITNDENSRAYSNLRYYFAKGSYVRLDKNFFGRESNVSVESPYSHNSPVALAFNLYSEVIESNIQVTDELVLSDLVPTFDSTFVSLSKTYMVSLPKKPVSDSQLVPDYLDKYQILKVTDVYNGYPNEILGLGVPYTLIEVEDDGKKDFYGYLPYLFVYSANFGITYPARAFLNANNLNEDTQAILLKNLMVNNSDNYSLFLSEGLMQTEKLFVVR